MENKIENKQQIYNPRPEDSPDSMLILILGIVSILVSFVFPGTGIIPSIIALVKFKKANQIYLKNPRNYTKQSSDYLKVGQITSIIGLVISALILLSILVAIGFVLFAVLYKESF